MAVLIFSCPVFSCPVAETTIKPLKRIRNNNDSKASDLSAVAETYARLGDKERASALLADAIKTAKRIGDSNSKVAALSAIAETFARLAEASNDWTLYDKPFRFIKELDSDENRNKILQSILASKLAVADVGRLRSLISHYSSGAGKAEALARILIAYSDPELIGKEKESEDDKDISSRIPQIF